MHKEIRSLRTRLFIIPKIVLTSFLLLYPFLTASSQNEEIYKNTEEFIPAKPGAQDALQGMSQKMGAGIVVDNFKPFEGERDYSNPDAKPKDSNAVVSVDQKGLAKRNILTVLSPISPSVIYVDEKNARVHVTVDVRVIACSNDLRSVDVHYFGDLGIQTDGINIPKVGGRGKGDVLVKGPDSYDKSTKEKLIVTAAFDTGPAITKYVAVVIKLKKASSTNLNALKTLHQQEKQAMNTLKKKVQQAQNNSVNPPQHIAELKKDFMDMGKQIEDMEKQIEEFKGIDTDITSPANQNNIEEIKKENARHEIEIIKKENAKYENELRKMKEELQPVMDQAEKVLESVVETLKWSDLDGITTIETSEDEYTVIESEIEDVHLVINGKGEIISQKDNRTTMAKVFDGYVLFVKDCWSPVKMAGALYDDLSFMGSAIKQNFTGENFSDEEWEYYLKRDKERDPTWRPLTICGQYIEVTSTKTAYEVTVDPITGLDRILVIDGPVTVRARNVQFEDQVLESGTVMTVDRDGMLVKEQFSREQLVSETKKYEAVLGMGNPALLEHNERPKAYFTFTPSTLQAGDDVSFTGTSYDPDGDDIQQFWFIGCKYIKALDNHRDWMYSVSETGSTSVRLLVRDSKGGVAEVTHTIHVGEEASASGTQNADSSDDASNLPGPNRNNNVPTPAFVMVPTHVVAGNPVAVISTSSDPDGDTLTYRWFVNGTYHESIDDLNRWEIDGSTPIGTHIIRMVVEDSRGGRAELSKRLVVAEHADDKEMEEGPIPYLFESELGDDGDHEITSEDTATPNLPPVAAFTCTPQSPMVDEQYALESISSDPDGDVLQVSWYFGEGENEEFISNEKYQSMSTWKSMEKVVTLLVKDPSGASNKTVKRIMIRPKMAEK